MGNQSIIEARRAAHRLQCQSKRSGFPERMGGFDMFELMTEVDVVRRCLQKAGVVSLAAIFSCWLAEGAVDESNTRPNIVVILADDLGYGDLGCYGADDMRTPVLDGMCDAGMRFENFYANCPVCSPTRASLLSGCYPDLVGVPGVIRTHPENSWGYLSPQIPLLPVAARKAGYTTAIVGKWHLGLTSPNIPTERGFDYFHGYLGDMMDDYYDHRRHGINYMRLGTQEIDPKGHATDLFAQWAVDYVTQRKNKPNPFLLYLAFNAPHSPIQPPDKWLNRVQRRENGISEKRARIVALIEHMDDAIGRLLRALAENGQIDNTIVLFTSDNGGSLRHGGTNGDLRDGKESMYEGGLKVPTFVVWPGRITTGSRTAQAGLSMDILPTLFDAAQIPFDKTSIDGRSLLPTLLGQDQAAVREQWFFVRREGGPRYGGKCIDAIRQGPWKLLQNFPYAPLELYNLDDDPLETTNLIDSHPGVVQRLHAALRQQIQRAGQVPWQPPE
jgi:arylsulfatase A-like enzyme